MIVASDAARIRVARLLAFIAAALCTGAALAAPLQIAQMQGADNCVALTFDDGPDVLLTPSLLSVLEEKGAIATFFVVGYRAAMWPDLVRRAVNGGNEIGNHSWSHPLLTGLGTEGAARQLARTDEQILSIVGRRPSIVRAPYGSVSTRIIALTDRPFIGWDVDTEDYLHFSRARIAHRAVSLAQNGSIVLMHDIHRATIAAVPEIIDGLRARGFRFVTVSALLGGACGGTPVGIDVVFAARRTHPDTNAAARVALEPAERRRVKKEEGPKETAQLKPLFGILPVSRTPHPDSLPPGLFVK